MFITHCICVKLKKNKAGIIKNKETSEHAVTGHCPRKVFDSRSGSVSHGVLRRLQGRGQRTHMYVSAAFNGMNSLRWPDCDSWFSLAEECENRKPQAPMLADAGQKPLSKI